MLKNVPYVIGHSNSNTFERRWVATLMPPSTQTVTLDDYQEYIHSEECQWNSADDDDEYYCDEDCNDNDQPTPFSIAYRLEIPWSSVLILLQHETYHPIPRIRTCCTSLCGFVPPYKDTPFTNRIYRYKGLPNIHTDTANVCNGASEILVSPTSSLTHTIAEGINSFWHAPFNQDLSDPQTVHRTLAEWEKYPEKKIALLQKHPFTRTPTLGALLAGFDVKVLAKAIPLFSPSYQKAGTALEVIHEGLG